MRLGFRFLTISFSFCFIIQIVFLRATVSNTLSQNSNSFISLPLEWMANNSEMKRIDEDRYSPLKSKRKTSDVTVAVCHPTLHGSPDLNLVFQFIRYYRHLGFDHIFFWYESHIRKNPLFDFIDNLPYVTLSELVVPDENKASQRRESKYHHQLDVQQACLGEYAQQFDWALVVDADEYLWFSEQMDVKDFLSRHKNLTYISIGKWMYTRGHKDAITNDTQLFGLRAYPYTPREYCQGRVSWSLNKQKHGCPTWVGRCKVMVRPQYHVDLGGVHGNPGQIQNGTSKHLDTNKVHLKEWCNLFGPPPRNTQIHSDRKSFNVTSDTGVNIHLLMAAHLKNEDKSVTMQYDDQLEEWLSYVSKLEPYDHRFIEERGLLRLHR